VTKLTQKAKEIRELEQDGSTIFNVKKSELESQGWDFSGFDFDIPEKLTVFFENSNGYLTGNIETRNGNLVAELKETEEALQDCLRIEYN